MDAQLQRDIQTIIGLADSFMEHWETDEGMSQDEHKEAATARQQFEDAKARIAALTQQAPSQEPTAKVRMVCRHCGSDKVHADSYATWNLDRQEWDLDNVFDKGAYCDSCDGDCRIDEVPA